MIWYIVGFVAAGIASGYLAGLFGIGGGILRVPIFVFLFAQFGVDDSILMHMATGTSLALVIPSALAASWKQHRLGNIDWHFYKWWAPFILGGVVVGLILMQWMSTVVLEGAFVLFLVFVALYVGVVPERFTFSRKPAKWVGLPIGMLSVWIGIGGGAFTTPFLKMHGWSMRKAIAMATATTFVVGTVGAIGAVVAGLGVVGRTAYSFGYVDLIAFACMLPFVFLFAPLGAKAAHHLNPKILRRIYAVFLLCMAATMLYELFPK